MKDLAVLKEIKAKNPMLATYPPDILVTGQRSVQSKVFTPRSGRRWCIAKDGRGGGRPDRLVERRSPGAKAYFDAHVARFQKEPDRWACAHGWAGLQILQQAVEKVGLDRKAIRDYIAANEFDTIIGKMRFKDGENISTPGMVSQWQKGEFEVIWPAARATAQPVFPKPDWK